MMLTSKSLLVLVASVFFACAIASPLPQGRGRGGAAAAAAPPPVLPEAPTEPEFEVEGLNLNTLTSGLPIPGGAAVPNEVAAGLIL